MLAERCEEINEWLLKHSASFYGALGFCPSDQTLIVLALARLKNYFTSSRIHYKDDVIRHRDGVLLDFLEGRQYDEAELKMAVALLWQSHDAKCDTIGVLERRLLSQRVAPPPRPRYPPTPHKRPRGPH